MGHNMSTIHVVTLEPKTGKGRNKINEAGKPEHWIVQDQRESPAVTQQILAQALHPDVLGMRRAQPLDGLQGRDGLAALRQVVRRLQGSLEFAVLRHVVEPPRQMKRGRQRTTREQRTEHQPREAPWDDGSGKG